MATPRTTRVGIRNIEIASFRGIAQLSLELTPTEPSQGQWIVLLGDNGAGKTSLLRALALALASPAVTPALITQSPSPMVRFGAKGASVRVRGGIEAMIDIATGTAEHVVNHVPAKVPVYAYGSLRGGALGGVQRDVRLDPLSGLATLFDPAASLIHADSWLLKIAYAATLEGEQGERTQLDDVRATLVSLLPGVEDLEVRRDRTWVKGPAVGEIPLANLSDGYLTTLGWTVDLLARWSEARRERGVSWDEVSRCIVLVDELDLHLHPRWQTEVISRLRAAFPRTTFVVTTHNPLTLHGTRPGEVHVMRRTDDGTVEVIQRDLPPGLSAEQVLTGEWFGLLTTLDPDTKEKLDRHNALLRLQRPPDDPERVKLEAELRSRLGRFGETSVERLAQQVVADVLDTGAPITNADRQRVKHAFEARLGRTPAPDKGTSSAKEPGPAALKPRSKAGKRSPTKATKARKRRRKS